ncbi:MAG TPA: TadE family type IV pilus minor pilin, partial [Actinotalea sp.]|nr:TadE family type IV pilus minor pilin [Actinotalea sp.]
VRPRRRRERGMATAELALALPSLVLVLAVALAAVDLGLAQVRCVDAARLGARLVARAEPHAVVLDEVRRAAPSGAQVVVATTGAHGTVTVTGRAPAVLRFLGVVDPPRATAVATLESAP